MALFNPFDSIDSRLSNIEKLLLEIYSGNHTKPPDNDPDALLTVSQAASMLHLSPHTIYGLLHRRQLPSLKRGRRVYFKKADLLKYVEDGRRNVQSSLGHKKISSTSSYKKGIKQ